MWLAGGEGDDPEVAFGDEGVDVAELAVGRTAEGADAQAVMMQAPSAAATSLICVSLRMRRSGWSR